MTGPGVTPDASDDSRPGEVQEGGTRLAADHLSALWARVRAGDDPLALGVAVLLVAVVAGLLWFWAGTRQGGVPAASAAPGGGGVTAGPGPHPPVDGAGGGPTTTVSGHVTVHVAGAVARPGLYYLPGGSRVADAVALAGGKVRGADLDRLNLAARLADGQKVFVARRGQAVGPDAGADGGYGAGSVAGGGLTAEPIDLNAADLAALDSLPGIGPATARAILEERTRRGGFRSTRDLLRVPGIGETRFARLRDRVRV